jgi:fumarylacetoacetase
VIDATIDHTHDPSRRSWVQSANKRGSDFPIQNLPLGVFRRAHSREAPRVGVAIGDYLLDVAACLTAGCFDQLSHELRLTARACAMPALNEVMARGAVARRELRHAVFDLLDEALPESLRQVVVTALVPIADAELLLPAHVGDYTDFYASVHHATNVGSMFRPDNPLLPNYKWVPIGYHGRASSIVVSDTGIARPSGQRKAPDAAAPTFGPSRMLDFELELGAFVGDGNALGESIPIAEAEQHLFGYVLLNDWSARDLQSWEYQPLGPFLAKNFATTISPWVVTLDALAPFRGPLDTRPIDDPAPLPYLHDENDRANGGVDITVEAWLSTKRMRVERLEPVCISKANARRLYWSMAQMLTHHASNGCNMIPGDLLGTGTISGPERDARGCLLELTWRGAEPLTLPNGEQRTFLEDGDEVILRGYCEREGFVRIGFGECRGVVGA